MKKIGVVLCVALMLSGCGTLIRGNSHNDYYRGINENIKIVNEPYLWILTAGIVPIISIISIPIDIAADTLLLPVDFAIKRKNDKENELRLKKKEQRLKEDEQKVKETEALRPSSELENKSSTKRWFSKSITE